MIIFSKHRNKYKCPVCGRKVGDNSRYCSECYMLHRDFGAGNQVLKITINSPGYHVRFLVMTICTLLLIVFAAYWLWDNFSEKPTTSPTNNVQTGKSKQKSLEEKAKKIEQVHPVTSVDNGNLKKKYSIPASLTSDEKNSATIKPDNKEVPVYGDTGADKQTKPSVSNNTTIKEEKDLKDDSSLENNNNQATVNNSEQNPPQQKSAQQNEALEDN